MLLQITENARDEVAKYFEDKEPKPLRIFLNSGG